MTFMKGKNNLNFSVMRHLQYKWHFKFFPQERLRTKLLWQWSGGKSQKSPPQCRVFKEITSKDFWVAI